MSGRVEGPELGPPEPPQGPDQAGAPAGPDAVGPVVGADGVAGVTPLAHEVRRVLAEAAVAGVDDREVCATLVGHLIRDWVSEGSREEIVRRVTEVIVDDPVFSQILTRLRSAPGESSPTQE